MAPFALPTAARLFLSYHPQCRTITTIHMVHGKINKGVTRLIEFGFRISSAVKTSEINE